MDMIHTIKKMQLELAANKIDCSESEIYDKIIESKLKMQEKNKIVATYQYFNKDEEWYFSTLEKINKKKLLCKKSLGHKECTIEIYGWIADQFKHLNLNYPFEENIQYMHANAVSILFENPDSFHKMNRWD